MTLPSLTQALHHAQQGLVGPPGLRSRLNNEHSRPRIRGHSSSIARVGTPRIAGESCESAPFRSRLNLEPKGCSYG